MTERPRRGFQHFFLLLAVAIAIGTQVLGSEAAPIGYEQYVATCNIPKSGAGPLCVGYKLDNHLQNNENQFERCFEFDDRNDWVCQERYRPTYFLNLPVIRIASPTTCANAYSREVEGLALCLSCMRGVVCPVILK